MCHQLWKWIMGLFFIYLRQYKRSRAKPSRDGKIKTWAENPGSIAGQQQQSQNGLSCDECAHRRTCIEHRTISSYAFIIYVMSTSIRKERKFLFSHTRPTPFWPPEGEFLPVSSLGAKIPWPDMCACACVWWRDRVKKVLRWNKSAKFGAIKPWAMSGGEK